MTLYGALQLWLTRGTTLFIDEVSMFVNDHGLHPSALAAPFNEHLELARRLLYAIGFKLFGARTSFMVARFAELVGVIILTGLVFVFVKRRVGPLIALAPALLLLFFGSAWELNFAISGIGNVCAIAGGIGALLMLERRTGRADLGACALLIVAVVSFTVGLAFAAGAACLLWFERTSRRRIWVALVPLAVYGAWLVWLRVVYVPANGEVQHIPLSNVLLIPNVIAQQAASTAGALAGLNYDFAPKDSFSIFSTSSAYGGLLAAGAAGALVWRLRRGAPPLLWALIATLVVYWVELALGSGIGRTPTTVRYVYASGVVAILIAAQAASRPIRSRAGLLMLFGLLALAVPGNLARLRQGMNFYRDFGLTMRAQLSAIELASPSADPGFTTHLGNPLFVPLAAGPYLQAVRRNGSPAYSEAELRQQPEAMRGAADSTMVAALRIAVRAQQPGERVFGCQTRVGAPGPSMAIAIASPGLALRSVSGGQLSLSRYASVTTVPVGGLTPGQTADLRIPRDSSRRAWRLMVTPAPAGLTVCGL